MSLLANYRESLARIEKTLIAKNSDYAGDSNAYKCFQLTEFLGNCSVEKGLVVRISDKLSRISTLLNNDVQVKDEAITDTLEDLANYALILASYIKDKKEQQV